MEITLTKETIIGLLQKYYEEDGRYVEIRIDQGKFVTPRKYLPKTIAIHCEVIEKIKQKNGLVVEQRSPLSNEEMTKMIAHVLLQSNFVVTGLNFELDKDTSQPIAKVTGEKVELSKTF